MAAAARLTDPLRTSPTAKIPGLLVSRNSGFMFSSSSLATGISVPVSRNPWLSSASWPASHPVLGLAPMKTNSPRMGSSDSAGWAARRIRTPSSWPVPVSAVTWVRGETMMRGFCSIRSIRYRDIEASSESPRMSMCTFAQLRLRKSAACPAELPPPTTATGLVPQAWASAWVAA